jgi:hypothetical protein
MGNSVSIGAGLADVKVIMSIMCVLMMKLICQVVMG